MLRAAAGGIPKRFAHFHRDAHLRRGVFMLGGQALRSKRITFLVTFITRRHHLAVHSNIMMISDVTTCIRIYICIYSYIYIYSDIYSYIYIVIYI